MQVEAYLCDKYADKVPTVEEIQDAVEKVMIENGHARTAKEYILYRAERTRMRDMNTRLMHIYDDLTFQDAKDNDIKRENANIDGDTAMGTMLKFGSEGCQGILQDVHIKAISFQGSRGGRHTYSRYGLPDTYNDLLSD